MAQNCARPACDGEIEDGYCSLCGLAPSAAARPILGSHAAHGTEVLRPASSAARYSTPSTDSNRSAAASTSITVHSTRAAARHRLGAGLVEIDPAVARDPQTAVMRDPSVPERRRFCNRCDEPVGRTRGDVPGRTEGFCRRCGQPFSFVPKLGQGEIIGGQYQVAGALAHGGLGWIYLATDRNVSDRWVVLKGLLNSGDEDALAAALAERRFLAEVEHPNIVKIFNFVEHGADGYIVMEFVNGTSLQQLLDTQRSANGLASAPLPAAVAAAFMVEILPALGHLHDIGLLFCDFKPDNVIQTANSLKLIDLGGVYRMDDQSSPVYGTAGYQAPEIGDFGPTIASDLFTVGRTFAALCTDLRSLHTKYRFVLPPQDDVAVFARHDSLYRFLQRATAREPACRFQSATEMAGQLHGVLRDIVAMESGLASPGLPSSNFMVHAGPLERRPSWRMLHTPHIRTDTPAAGFVMSLASTKPDAAIEALRAQPEELEIKLWLARLLIQAQEFGGAEQALRDSERLAGSDWRISWYRGIAALASGETTSADGHFRAVYMHLPGELAPKLALAVCAEVLEDLLDAARWYEIVSRVDPTVATAVFGLARVRLRLRDHAGAVEAYELVSEQSSAFTEARIRVINLLLTGAADVSAVSDLSRASGILERLTLDRETRHRLTPRVLEKSLDLVTSGAAAGGEFTILGDELTERAVRVRLERTYRLLARSAGAARERIALADEANNVRPRSLL